MSDFFIASDPDLNCLHSPPAESLLNERLDSEVDLLMLCNLESILTGTEWESVFDRVYINPVRDHGPDGPWIYEVSSCLLAALQGLTPDTLLDCARKWGETDEWTLRDDIAPETIVNVLRGLAGMAELAHGEGNTLFIRTEP